MLDNRSGLRILSLVTSAQEKYLSSHRGGAELVQDVTGGGAISNANHIRTLGEEIRDGKKDRESTYKTKIKGLFRNLKGIQKCLILRSKSTGAQLSVRGTTVSGTVLFATEFWYFLCAHYNVSPLNLQRHCDGRGTAFRSYIKYLRIFQIIQKPQKKPLVEAQIWYF